MISKHFPASPISQRVLTWLVHPYANQPPDIRLSWSYLGGFVFTAFGCLIAVTSTRDVNYREPSDSFVRHPFHFGALMIGLFSIPCYYGPGTYVWECWISQWRVVRILMCMLLALYLVFWWRVILRVRADEDTLKREFPKEWDEWAEEVPSKLIPCIC